LIRISYQKTSAYLPILLAAIFLPVVALGQKAEEKQPSVTPHAMSVEGVWQNVITPVDCQTGTPFGFTIPGLLTYHADGTIAETGGSPPNLSRSPGHGIWKRIKSRNYTGTFAFLLFDAAGNFVGTEKITQDIRLNSTGDGFTDTATFQIYDPMGNPVQGSSGCARAAATRFE
jgi:hypothetical protein